MHLGFRTRDEEQDCASQTRDEEQDCGSQIRGEEQTVWWSHPPVRGSGGRSDSLFLAETEDFTGTGKNPRRKSAMPRTWAIMMKEVNTDVRIFMLTLDSGSEEV